MAPLGFLLLLPVDTVNSVQTLKVSKTVELADLVGAVADTARGSLHHEFYHQPYHRLCYGGCN
jgi:hypothetical protein